MHHFGLWDYSVSYERAAPVLSVSRVVVLDKPLIPERTIIMQTTFKLFFSFMLCLGLILVSGCGSSDSAHPSGFVGKWETNYGVNLELLKDGTVLRTSNIGTKTGTWKVENERLYLMDPSGTNSFSGAWSYGFADPPPSSGWEQSLLLTDDDGNTTRYTRQR